MGTRHLEARSLHEGHRPAVAMTLIATASGVCDDGSGTGNMVQYVEGQRIPLDPDWNLTLQPNQTRAVTVNPEVRWEKDAPAFAQKPLWDVPESDYEIE